MKNKKNEQHSLTCKLKRACEHCGEPIADQEHRARKHCKYEKNDGIIKDCKTAKARKNDAGNRKFFQEHNGEIKDIDKRIGLMLEKKGEQVNLMDLEAYDIHLDKTSEFSFQPNDNFICRYYHYSIQCNPFTQTFKILKND